MRVARAGAASDTCGSGELPSVASVCTMCCIHVVPLFGYEVTKTSLGRKGKFFILATVLPEQMGSSGNGSSGDVMIRAARV